jgi:outer membrane protein assembly factor BamB
MRHVLVPSTGARRGAGLGLVASVLLLLLLAFASSAGALPPQGVWQWAAPYVSIDAVHGFTEVAAGPTGSIYTAGHEYGWGPAWTVARVDAATGAEIWSQRLDPAEPAASANAIATDPSRNLIVAGRCDTRGGDVVVRKYRASDGTLLWSRRWDGGTGKDDRADVVTTDALGNVYVAGFTTGSTYANALLLKYSAAGKLLWKYVLSSATGAEFEAIARDGAGNVYLTGTTGINSTERRLVTLKVSPTGAKLWQRTISGLGVSYSGQHLKVKGTAVYVVGSLEVSGGRPVILKYSLAGATVWKYASDGVSSVNDMTVDAKGRVVMVGWMYTTAWGPQMMVGSLEVRAPDGTAYASAMWPADFGPGAVYPAMYESVVTDPDCRIYIAGNINTSPTWGVGNAMVVRWPSPDGGAWAAERIWRYDGPSSDGYDAFYGILRTGDGAVYAAGQRAGIGTEGVLHRISLMIDG